MNAKLMLCGEALEKYGATVCYDDSALEIAHEISQWKGKKIIMAGGPLCDHQDNLIVCATKIPNVTHAWLFICGKVPELACARIFGLAQKSPRACKVWQQMIAEASGLEKIPAIRLALAPYGVTGLGVCTHVHASTPEQFRKMLNEYENEYLNSLIINSMNSILSNRSVIVCVHGAAFDKMFEELHKIVHNEFGTYISRAGAAQTHQDRILSINEFAKTRVLLVDCSVMTELIPFSAADDVFAVYGNYPKVKLVQKIN